MDESDTHQPIHGIARTGPRGLGWPSVPSSLTSHRCMERDGDAGTRQAAWLDRALLSFVPVGDSGH
jgi:hypothetical protein